MSQFYFLQISSYSRPQIKIIKIDQEFEREGGKKWNNDFLCRNILDEPSFNQDFSILVFAKVLGDLIWNHIIKQLK